MLWHPGQKLQTVRQTNRLLIAHAPWVSIIFLLCIGLLDKPADIQLPERTPLAQDEIDALQKLIEGTEVNIDDIIATGQGITLKEAQQLLAEKGHEDAENLKTRLLQESKF